MNTALLNVSEISVHYKNKVALSDLVVITSSIEAFRMLKNVYKDFIEHHEEFWVIYLNRANKVIGISQISKGGLSSTTIDVRIILQIALNTSASAIIISHNHPSDNLTPSNDDIIITQQIKKACDIMDIKLLDHLILSSNSYFSFMDKKLL